MSENDTSSYKTVRGLTRGLNLLSTLNRIDGGASTARLAELVGLHRTTVRRLLETLQAEGYVRRSDSDDSYRLELKVRELSEGFRDEQWISASAAPLLAELLQEVVWPSDLTTLDVDAMVVRETTHRFSRLSFHRSMVGRRLSLLHTAAGLTYLAYCPDAEREQLIDMLARRADEEYQLAREPAKLENLLLRTRHKGFGENYKNWIQEEKVAAIAVPVHSGERLLGCLSLIYMAPAMTIEQAADRYLGNLRRTADKIEAELATTTDNLTSGSGSSPDSEDTVP